MARFVYFSMSVLSLLSALTNTGAAPVRIKRAVTQTADDFKELEYAFPVGFLILSNRSYITHLVTQISRFRMV